MHRTPQLAKLYQQIHEELTSLGERINSGDHGRALDALGEATGLVSKTERAETLLTALLSEGCLEAGERQQLKALAESARQATESLIARTIQFKQGVLERAGHMQTGRQYLSRQTEVPKGTQLDSRL